MPINFESRKRLFLLQAGETSYAMVLSKTGYLCHLYWGKKIEDIHVDFSAGRISCRHSFHIPEQEDPSFSLEKALLEYPSYGNSDFRTPAVQIVNTAGSAIVVPKYQKHRIYKGKPLLDGLPATYVENDEEADTLEITLLDDWSGVEIILLYTAYAHRNVITRSARLTNAGTQTVTLRRAFSASVDMPCRGYRMLQLSGAWGRERQLFQRQLVPGMQSIESRRGASSHQQNPFVALLSPEADEKNGSVYGLSLVYSGNFYAGAEMDSYANGRFFIGLNPFDFSWQLQPGQSFQTPEAVLVYSNAGLGEMSRTFHSLYRERLCRGKYRDRERPVLFNNWEATRFGFDSRKIVELAKDANGLGMELFVLDDGWFGKRNSDTCSLGDWTVNLRKIPEGLDGLAEAIHRTGMKFGLWVEPEMISPDSDLYRLRPDWCIHAEGRTHTLARHQLVLDLSRTDVCEALEQSLTKLISGIPIDYIKWDMNRNITEAGSALLPPERQGEVFHRYILGLYRILDKLTAKFPDVLFESCASGGGRFDPGMLYYMPQTWTSDDTDAVERVRIQYGTSLVYPASAIGAHVSAVPNQQVMRITPLKTRGHVAMTGNFGYELDIGQLSADEREEIRKQVETYKSVRRLVQFGELYRLKSPFEGNSAAWMYVSRDQSEACAFYFRTLGAANIDVEYLKFEGLAENKKYQNVLDGSIRRGDELMHLGVPVLLEGGDFQSCMWHFKTC